MRMAGGRWGDCNLSERFCCRFAVYGETGNNRYNQLLRVVEVPGRGASCFGQRPGPITGGDSPYPPGIMEDDRYRENEEIGRPVLGRRDRLRPGRIHQDPE